MYTLIFALILAVFPLDYADLALSTTEAQPGQSYTAYATLYGQGEHVVTIADQSATVELDGEHGVIVAFPLVAPTVARLDPYRVELRVDGVVVDTRGLRVCCAKWPDARRVVWLPMVAKSP